MDLISNRTIDVTKLAMDGLMMRQKAITANTANVTTPGYQRKEVNFENQLKEIIEKDDLKTYIKEQNSIEYNPTSLDMVMDQSANPGLTPQQSRYLQSGIYGNYNPQITDDTASGSDSTGNNVNLESEVMDMASVGLRYNVLATLEGKQLKLVGDAIKGSGS
jgi:flagellar basal body rod protein FlgB